MSENIYWEESPEPIEPETYIEGPVDRTVITLMDLIRGLGKTKGELKREQRLLEHVRREIARP